MATFSKRMIFVARFVPALVIIAFLSLGPALPAEKTSLFIGFGLGLVIVIALVVLGKKIVKSAQPDLTRLKILNGLFVFVSIGTVAYVTGAAIVIFMGDYPPCFSIALIPLVIFGLALASLGMYAKMMRVRLAMQMIVSGDETKSIETKNRQRVLGRRASVLLVLLIISTLDGAAIGHFSQRIELENRTTKLTKIQYTIASIKESIALKTETPAVIKHRLEVVQQELNALN